MRKNDLVKIQNAPGALIKLQGLFGRVVDEGEKGALISIPEGRKFYGTDQFRLSPSCLKLILTSEGLTLSTWQYLAKTEKARVLKQAVRSNREQGWYQDFESYIVKDESISLLDGFLEITQARMVTHNHYGSKAIFEQLRYHSELKDSCVQFKVNNNYTASLARLVNVLFPETDGFFEKRRAA